MARQKAKRIRRDEAVAQIQAGIEALQELACEIEDWKENMAAADMEHLPKYEELEECFDTLTQGIEEVESAATELESVEFPGAF